MVREEEDYNDDEEEEIDLSDPEVLEEINKNLQILGFTINDSRIYVTLLQIGFNTPAKIAENSKVDRARVYDSLKRLVKRGVVEEEPVPRAPRYRALPPEKVFGKIRGKLNKKIKLANELEDQLNRIKQLPSSESNSIWAIRGEKKIRKQFYKFLKQAEDTCYIITTLDDSRGSIRELENLTDHLIDKKENNPNFSIHLALKIFPESVDQKIYINHLYHAGIDVYRWNAGAVLPFGIYLTEKAYLQAYLSSLTPKPSYEQGFYLENASKEQISGFKHLCLWVYSHLCQKVVFRKKNKKG